MVKVFLEDGVELPSYATNEASGADVKAIKLLQVYKGETPIEPERLEKLVECFSERDYIKLRGHERALFGTGVHVLHIDPTKEIQARPRSGVSLKRGLLVANSPGTIDSDYRGEIGIIIYNSNPFLAKVERGEKIAQLVVADVPYPRVSFVVDNIATESERGGNGFGSTGK